MMTSKHFGGGAKNWARVVTHLIAAGFWCASSIMGFSAPSVAEGERATRPEVFAPGWKVLARASGDLNADGRADVAVAFEAPGGKGASARARPRMLLIALKGPQGDYQPALRDFAAIKRADEGGIWGDPFQALTIERGAVVVKHEGGSNWRWAFVDRFALRAGRWRWIGETCNVRHTGDTSSVSRDTNLATGEVILACAPGRVTANRGRWEFREVALTPARQTPRLNEPSDWPGPVMALRTSPTTRLRVEGRVCGTQAYLRFEGSDHRPALFNRVTGRLIPIQKVQSSGKRHRVTYRLADLNPVASEPEPLDQLPGCVLVVGPVQKQLSFRQFPRAGWPELGDVPRSRPDL